MKETLGCSSDFLVQSEKKWCKVPVRVLWLVIKST